MNIYDYAQAIAPSSAFPESKNACAMPSFDRAILKSRLVALQNQQALTLCEPP
jgi:hypothetical protein